MSGNEMRERLILPVLIPVGALAFVGALALGVASVLLNVPKHIATGVALMVAFNGLVMFTVFALRPRITPTLGLFMICIVAIPLVLGAGVATGVVKVKDTGEEGKEPAEPTVMIAAQNIAFDVTELKIPAGREFVIDFNNKEAQPHNVAIMTEMGSGDVKFRGEIVQGPKEVKYKVGPIEAGTYHFHCDVHPNMQGTVLAEGEGGGESPAGDAGTTDSAAH